ncbi:hypothetical protein Cme02nite_73260 [Catellatospora methionotrophica]|uniref:Peptidase M48 domain-containing protein n=1 Tax=Catellatospora methionotrophica TaxID=121620 RepID=A0A8J3PJN3_9ACTN|nr:hypothetical protein [Catellatospora methionotrophica]GIG18994.1 hypothetical protein Cme02nite_73260 [Catellatospora methionotrophica]
MTTTAPVAAVTAALPRPLVPPWLWLFSGLCLLGTAWNLPRLLTDPVAAARDVFDRGSHAEPAVTAMLAVLGVCSVLPTLLIGLALVAVLLPRVRGRLVERRLVPPGALPARTAAAVAQMQSFVDGIHHGVVVRLSGAPGNGGAQVYAAGWREPRILAYPALVALWEHEPAAARAILVHELGHIRNGEHLLVGRLGPFALLARAWAPVYLALLAVPPLLLPIADEQAFAVAASLLGGAVTAAPSGLIAPVLALWLAELAADRVAADDGRAKPLAGTLTRGRRTFGRLLTHPPRWLRRALLRRPDPATVLVLAAWPLTFLGELALLGLAALIASAGERWTLAQAWHHYTGAGYGVASAGLRTCLVAALLLLCWPWLSGGWPALWTRGRVPVRRRSGVALHVAAAMIPLAVAAAVVAVRPVPPGQLWSLDYPTRLTTELSGFGTVMRPEPDLPGNAGPGWTGGPLAYPVRLRTTAVVSLTLVGGRGDRAARATAVVVGSVWEFTADGRLVCRPSGGRRPVPGTFTADGPWLHASAFPADFTDLTSDNVVGRFDLLASPPRAELHWIIGWSADGDHSSYRIVVTLTPQDTP